MIDHDCWKSEHDWDASRCSSSEPLTRTALFVLFDGGAQHRFSSVRVSLLLGKDVSPEQRVAWGIVCPSSLPIVSRISTQNKPTAPNDSSLPVCHIVFVADRHSARSQAIGLEIARLCGEIVLAEPGSLTSFGVKLFEFDHPLTGDTQSVSVSFTSSNLLSTTRSHGIFPDQPSQPATVGRVVRVIPSSKRRVIPLPTDILLIVFEGLRSPPTYRGWRRDLLNCALVCREWVCALSFLLIDFRSQDNQQGHPPEIISLANGLAACPNLCLDVKHLSAGYLERHPTWNPFPVLPPGTPSTMFLAKLRLQQSKLRRSRFAKAFLSILHLSKNVQTLALDSANDLVVVPNDLAGALSELTRLDTFSGRCMLTMGQLLSCVATWPSLKRLSLLSILPHSACNAPLPSLSCHLTELALVDVPVGDDELMCLVNASSTSLQRLTLDHVLHLSNAGLGTALASVCRSLTYLCVTTNALSRGWGEEHALDVTIASMARLTELKIVPDVASECMIERRADVFVKQRTATVLSEVHLELVVGRNPVPDGLISAVGRDWPGWRIDEGLRG